MGLKETDAVAQAREGVWGALEDWQNTTRTTAQVHRDVDAALDAYAAAVRAECAAKVDDAINEGLVQDAFGYASARQVEDPMAPFALCVASHIACEVSAVLANVDA